MNRRSMLAALALFPIAARVRAAGGAADFSFASIDGGVVELSDLRGGPVLVVNTASRCGFSGQYNALQALYDTYQAQGLTVLGVPSNSFRQELKSAEEVKDFCEVNFAIDFPMTGIVEVKGDGAHPFYTWAAAQGVRPAWNFHKILLDGDGKLVGQFPTVIKPTSARITRAIEGLLVS